MLQAQIAGSTPAQGYEDELLTEIENLVVSTGRAGDDAGANEPTRLCAPSPEPSEDMSASHGGLETWGKPTTNFIIKQARKAGFRLSCRVCGSQEAEDTSSYVLCGGCGPVTQPAHRHCLAKLQDHCPNQPHGQVMYGDPCQEVDFEDFIYTSWLLDCRFIDQDKESLHIDDLWSTWFGVPHDQEGPKPQLFIYPRLQRLVAAAHGKPVRQYPSLVSFVGDTGSGKSTIIRAIIRMLAPRAHKDYRAPVPGTASNEFDSTSSDVHLFADPGTLFSEVPLMFVDCEGFSGTDTPVSRRILSDAKRAEVSEALRDSTLRNATASRSAKDLLAEHAASASHIVNLKWGQVVAPVQPTSSLSSTLSRRSLGYVDADSRQVVVKSLYPRLLYAFSDVVCFVTNNAKASHTILEEMFKWAKDGHEKTLNQRVRPGLVIVLNKMAQESHEVLSSVEKATRQLLDSFQRSSRYGELRMKWAARGRTINKAEDLILCYYDSFRVISIPQHTKTSPATARRISAQIKVLYGEIRDVSYSIRKKRRALNMDLDVASLNAYLLQSVTALARDHHNALDFHRLAEGDSALPRRFSEHLLQLLSNMVKHRRLDQAQEVGGESGLITSVIPYIAASIVAQTMTDNNKGPDEYQTQKDFLVDEARRGLEYFRDRYWRCEAKDASGQRRCRNYLEAHDKGHQFDPAPRRLSSQGRVSDVSVASEDNLEIGEYESSYNPDAYTDRLWREISQLQSQEEANEKLASAAMACGVSQITGQRTCLVCLSNTPTNALPCRPGQHCICQDCLRRYSASSPQPSVVKIHGCPLGCTLTSSPWTIRVKPKTAGARILALDGGGVRGIVELAILAEIEKAVGLGIRIQELFDLVVGTSTGGIVALGVFEKGWTLDTAIQRFRSLAFDAFTLRPALSLPVLSIFAEPFCDYRYKSSGIESTLQQCFGDGFLFGQASTSTRGDQVKVGVVTCLEGRNQPCLAANYSRNPVQGKNGKDEYDWLQREDQQRKDFRTWQAARATSAAPILFEPYAHQPTARTYVDGAVVRNNPVRLAYDEDKRIWSSKYPKVPDIIVSIGTGIQVEANGRVKESRSHRLEKVKKLLPGGIRKKVEAGLDMVNATLDCHREWVDFKGAMQGSLRRNSHRLDVGLLEKPPPLDAVQNMQSLLNDCQDYFSPPSYSAQAPPPRYMDSRYATARAHIHVVARRLIASLFYLSHVLPGDMKGGRYKSHIHCRLTPQSESAISLLGLEPQFRMREVGSENNDIINAITYINPQHPFNRDTLSSHVQFEVSEGHYTRYIEVQFARRETEWEPIGGF
ncbi:hypothetical protein QBC46DRAFT_352819 [Diplogelasinospora grovesii]|uniref:PNPLA domain-containing protein n=1 Tax=Diplogelasinospora grovesii TaxID=303347 RepID=A0AAN6S6L7_9PEZI|nr:hypothetical protein QBC46DRAFT_352819 [Diplogelasinospora grovesii]